MSEKKQQIIYISEYSSERLALIRQHQYLNIMVGMHPHDSTYVHYILKSKYDELLKSCEQNDSLLRDRNNEHIQLLRDENEKLKAELEKVKFKPSNIVISTETTYTKQNNPTK